MIHDMPTPDIVDEAKKLLWNKLGGVTTQTATPPEESMDNVRVNVGRGLPWFHEKCLVGDRLSRRIALVGGGPSLKETVFELLDFTTVMVCGSAHDWVQQNSPRVPKLCAVCDPDPITANYLRHPDKQTTYLVASQCHSSVFEALEGHDIILWHCWPVGSDEKSGKEFLNEKTPGWVAVGGGCTVGLRSVSMAIMMGYSDIHFFGFDSCMSMEDDHHAYPFTDPEKEFLGDIYDVRIGMGHVDGPKERVYRVAGYQLAQAEHYKQTLMAMGHAFKPTFHGPGLLADVQAMIDLETKRLEQEQAA
jgi:hypothetical protein